ncbi:helix-turn-helix transcriptional regulator [Paraburkholderia bryophila]|uniref:winged helix-turn-helix transcriptional regulator n=1 Tax=Paraburkholderia bryophila TaxID=420952 RepID=UPI002349A390|nr:helix-turn-helix domain-containing protein [Paraburkholderia bryophila]WCM23866.1 helix-turn-helix transcriptional regulator [Paraburkholderia bryophila]
MPRTAEASPDALLPSCPSRSILSRIGQKWTLLAIVALREETLRFGDIRRRIHGVSDKMLTQTLRSMERDGLVQRHAYDPRQQRVEYGLSPLAQSLLPIVAELKQWAERSSEIIESSNQAFDRKSAL